MTFYTEVLGFRVSDWRDDSFAFLRCGVDHHTVNFVRDAAPQLHHIAFEVKDWGESIALEKLAPANPACLRALGQERDPRWGPGRHIIGHNIAAYHRNADNVRVEFFAEMDLMKDEALGYFDPRPWHQDRPQRPKVWPADTLRNYWGFGSEGTFQVIREHSKSRRVAGKGLRDDLTHILRAGRPWVEIFHARDRIHCPRDAFPCHPDVLESGRQAEFDVEFVEAERGIGHAERALDLRHGGAAPPAG